MTNRIKFAGCGDNWVNVVDPRTNTPSKVCYREVEDVLGNVSYKITKADPELVRYLGKGRIESAIYLLEA